MEYGESIYIIWFEVKWPWTTKLKVAYVKNA